MKKLLLIGGAGLVLSLFSGCAASADYASAEYSRDAEIANLRRQNQALADQVAALNRYVAEQKRLQSNDMVPIRELFELYYEYDYNRLNPALVKRYLDTLSLPEKPTRAEAVDYLSVLYRLRRMNLDENMRTFLTGRVAALGRDYLPQMLLYSDANFVANAIRTLIRKEDKPLLRQAMLVNRNNYTLVRILCSIADKEDLPFLIEQQNNIDEIYAVIARLSDPETLFPLLKKAALAGTLQVQQMRILMNSLNEKERSELMEILWKNAQMRVAREQGRNWAVFNHCYPLAQAGYLPAFEVLCKTPMADSNLLVQIMNLTPISLENLLKNWWKENQGKIRFDSFTGKYVPVK